MADNKDRIGFFEEHFLTSRYERTTSGSKGTTQDRINTAHTQKDYRRYKGKVFLYSLASITLSLTLLSQAGDIKNWLENAARTTDPEFKTDEHGHAVRRTIQPLGDCEPVYTFFTASSKSNTPIHRSDLKLIARCAKSTFLLSSQNTDSCLAAGQGFEDAANKRANSIPGQTIQHMNNCISF